MAEQGSPEPILRGIIDRLEGPYAVLILDEREQELLWPRELLPAGAEEGMAITLRLGLNGEDTARRRARIRGLLGGIFGAEENGEEAE